jgi:hypothetical protein
MFRTSFLSCSGLSWVGTECFQGLEEGGFSDRQEETQLVADVQAASKGEQGIFKIMSYINEFKREY